MQKVLLFLLFCGIFGLTVTAQTKSLVVADFDNEARVSNLGEEFGTWNGFPNDQAQGCRMSFAKDDALGKKDGRSIALNYDVDSPNAAYNGFWLKISDVKNDDFDTLSFYVKGSGTKGFTRKINVELKDKRNGKATFPVENITDRWQKISLTLDRKNIDSTKKKPFAEFVVVFADTISNPETGEILIDQIEFSHSL